MMDPMTRANLEAALACEALAALRYSLFADRAEDEGLDEVGQLFEAICCDQRRECAREIANALGIVLATRENLATALEGEVTEHHRLFPLFAAQARRVGDREAAELFVALGRQEHVHADRIRAAMARLGAADAPG
jgi:rubrerythrin